MKRQATKKPNAIVLTQHQWKAMREAGFHAIGRSLLKANYQVFFATAPINFAYLTGRVAEGGPIASQRLLSGIRYEEFDSSLSNFSTFDFTPPLFLRRFVSNKLRRNAEKKLLSRARRVCANPNVIVLESIRLIGQLDFLLSLFPRTPIVYRPSDPIYARDDMPEWLKRAEVSLVRHSQLVLTVNDVAKSHYTEISSTPEKIQTLPNGIHLDQFLEQTPHSFSPAQPTISYIGASGPNWNAIINAAKTHSKIRFKIVCPVLPPTAIKSQIASQNNILHIPGVPPESVAEHVTTSDAVMAAYPSNCKNWARGGHAKLYQAIAAKKPSIGLYCGIGSRPYLSISCSDEAEFIKKIPLVFSSAPAPMSLINGLSWEAFEETFSTHVLQITKSFNQ